MRCPFASASSLALLSILATAGCPGGPPDRGAVGTVVVGVTSDLRVGIDVDRVHAVLKADGEVVQDEVLGTGGDAALAFPAEFTFADVADEALVEIALDAFHPGDAENPIVTRLASTRAIAGKKMLLRATLDSHCTAAPGGTAPACDAPTTCIGGTCANAYVDPGKLVPYTSTWATASNDLCKKDGSSPVVTVGEGQGDYLPTSDGAVAQVEAGPQGGHHIWVAIRMKGLRQSGSITSITGHFPDLDLDVGPFNVIFTFDQDEGGYCKLYGLRFQLDTVEDIHTMLGHELEVKVTVTDPDGDVGVGTRTVMLSSDIL